MKRECKNYFHIFMLKILPMCYVLSNFYTVYFNLRIVDMLKVHGEPMWRLSHWLMSVGIAHFADIKMLLMECSVNVQSFLWTITVRWNEFVRWNKNSILHLCPTNFTYNDMVFIQCVSSLCSLRSYWTIFKTFTNVCLVFFSEEFLVL